MSFLYFGLMAYTIVKVNWNYTAIMKNRDTKTLGSDYIT